MTNIPTDFAVEAACPYCFSKDTHPAQSGSLLTIFNCRHPKCHKPFAVFISLLVYSTTGETLYITDVRSIDGVAENRSFDPETMPQKLVDLSVKNVG